MTGDAILAALHLPVAARVERRVPKSLLLEHGSPASGDKRRIQEGLDQVQWLAALKPTNIGVAAFRDDTREYLEIAVLRVVLREGAQFTRILDLLHRAVPYPVLAVAELGRSVNLSLAHKRWSKGEAGRTVLEAETVAVDAPLPGQPHVDEFLAALDLARQPQASLFALYQGWIDVLYALESARRTGRFEILEAAARLEARRDALHTCAQLEAEMVRLRRAAAKAKQMPRQIELNLEYKRAEAAHTAALAHL